MLLSPEDVALIRQCDTAFVSSYHASDNATTSHRVDISHRGGERGFIRVVDETTLAWPEYAGNNMYMTLGNLQATPHAGLLLFDFDDQQRTLQLTGTVRLGFASEARASRKKSPLHDMDNIGDRFVIFTLSAPPKRTSPNSLPYQFSYVGDSPYNPSLKGFQGVSNVATPLSTATCEAVAFPSVDYGALVLTDMQRWSAGVATFIFSCVVTERDLSRYLWVPGQYATIELHLPDKADAAPLMRSWTVTDLQYRRVRPVGHTAEPSVVVTLSLTVKQAENGLVSTWLHRQFHEDDGHLEDTWTRLFPPGSGLSWRLKSISGDFTPFVQWPRATSLDTLLATQRRGTNWAIDATDDRLWLIGAGVGLTPALAILKQLLHRDPVFLATSRVRSVTLLASFRSIEEAEVLRFICAEDDEQMTAATTASPPLTLHIHVFLTARSPLSAVDRREQVRRWTTATTSNLATRLSSQATVQLQTHDHRRITYEAINRLLLVDSTVPTSDALGETRVLQREALDQRTSSRGVYLCGPSPFMQALQYAPTTLTAADDAACTAGIATPEDVEAKLLQSMLPAWWTERVRSEDFYF